MIWVGLPQLLIFPFIPLLMKRFDLRGLVCFGTLIFAASCIMNTSMSHDYAGDQFVISNIVRALGQPFTIVPLSALATALLQPKDTGEGSAVFNIARNVGGSVGTAMLDTILTRREQFHDFEIGASINSYRSIVQDRIQAVTAVFVNKGSDVVTATHQAYGQVKDVIRREAYIMAFNDAFLVLGVSLLIGAVLVWFCYKTKPQGNAVAH
jgi:DHA2 family multidrug resistance protein